MALLVLLVLLAVTAANADATTRIIPRAWLGCNLGAGTLEAAPWANASFLSALAALPVGSLRYPSGTLGNYWNWSAGQQIGGATPGNGLAEFADALPAGVEPTWMLNLLTDTLDSQLEFLAAIASRELPVGVVELANEMYLEKADYISKFPTGADYGAEAARWIRAISAVYPNASIAVCGVPSGGGSGGSARHKGWNAGLFAALKAAGIADKSYHVAMVGARRHSPLPELGRSPQYTATDITLQHEYHNSGLACPGCKMSAADVPVMLGQPFLVTETLRRAVTALPPAVDSVWVTEWALNMNAGAVDAEADVFGTWASGLFAAELALLWLGIPRVAFVQKHELVGAADAGQLFASDRAFDFPAGSPDRALATQPFARSASGWALAAVAAAARGAGAAALMSFSPNPVVHGGPGGSAYPSLLGAAFYPAAAAGANSSAAVVLNLAPSSITLPASATAGYDSWSSSAADPTAAISTAHSVVRTAGALPLPGGAGLALPPYSITLLLLR